MNISLDLHKRFIKGLAAYGLTPDDMNNWRYCGGRNGEQRHANYFKMFCPNDDLPDLTDKCICGHTISENCYITNDEEILIVGNCCIKKFLPHENAGRTCQICKKPHKNRKNNKCKDCRKKYCEQCDKEKYHTWKTCKDCAYSNSCNGCGKKIFQKYLQCYNCRYY